MRVENSPIDAKEAGRIPWSDHGRKGRSNTRWARRVKNRDQWTCQRCGHLGRAVRANHITSVRNGGQDALENGMTLCRPCHNRKTQREAMQGSNRWKRPKEPHPGFIRRASVLRKRPQIAVETRTRSPRGEPLPMDHTQAIHACGVRLEKIKRGVRLCGRGADIVRVGVTPPGCVHLAPRYADGTQEHR